jgi:DNA-binding PadR family transcriptional regulator
MSEFNANDFEEALDFFILSGFSDGPRSLLEIQQRVKWAEGLLVLAAARKWTRSLGSLTTALERLQHEGWLKPERLGEQPGPEIIYSLTDAGDLQLEQERARRHLIVSQFVEDGELDGSFRRFLNSNGPLGPNY